MLCAPKRITYSTEREKRKKTKYNKMIILYNERATVENIFLSYLNINRCTTEVDNHI